MQTNILVINKTYMYMHEVSISCRDFLQPNCQQTKPIQHMLSIIMAMTINAINKCNQGIVNQNANQHMLSMNMARTINAINKCNQ